MNVEFKYTSAKASNLSLHLLIRSHILVWWLTSGLRKFPAIFRLSGQKTQPEILQLSYLQSLFKHQNWSGCSWCDKDEIPWSLAEPCCQIFRPSLGKFSSLRIVTLWRKACEKDKVPLLHKCACGRSPDESMVVGHRPRAVVDILLTLLSTVKAGLCR